MDNKYQGWAPPRIFYSHATKDDKLTGLIDKCLKFKGYDVYLAERNLVGKPLIDKLKNEMLSCNAILVGYTNGMEEKHIISFEVGMAYSLGLPVFLFCVDSTDMPWFFDKVTDYEKIESVSESHIRKAIEKIDPTSMLDPIDIFVDQYIDPQRFSSNVNEEVTNINGSLCLWDGYNHTLKFYLINKINRPVKDLRYQLLTTKNIIMECNPGELDGTSQTQRNEHFLMWPPSRKTNILNWYWTSFPPMNMSFDIRISSETITKDDYLEIKYNSENTIGWKRKVLYIHKLDNI